MGPDRWPGPLLSWVPPRWLCTGTAAAQIGEMTGGTTGETGETTAETGETTAGTAEPIRRKALRQAWDQSRRVPWWLD